MAATLEEVGQALAAADQAGAADDARALARLYKRMQGEADMRRMADPTSGIGGMQLFKEGAGKAVADIGRGIGQIARVTPQADVDEARRLDKPLMRTGAGVAGNIAGNLAMVAPTAFVPGANTYTGAGLVGGIAGALQPTAENESRLVNTGLGAGLGVGGQAAGNALGRVLRPVAPRLGPEEQALAQAAQREGIPLTAGQATGSRPLKTVESVFENLPLTSGPQLATREAQQRAFTAAALKRSGIQSDSAGAATLFGQKQALGDTMSGIAEKSTLDFNKTGLADKLTQIVANAEARLPPASASKVAGTVDQILSQVDDAGRMSGTNYQGWREPLRSLRMEGGATGNVYGDIRRALDDAFRSGLAGAEGDAYRGASRQYANLKATMNAMGGPGNLPATGQVSPAALGASLARSVGKEGRALGQGDMNELARIGQVFVREQVPNSGTAQRQLAQMLLTTGGGASAGGGTALATGGDFTTGAGVGAGIGAGALVAPRAAQALMNSAAGQAYLKRGLVALTPTQRQALAAALRSAAISTEPALNSRRE